MSRNLAQLVCGAALTPLPAITENASEFQVNKEAADMRTWTACLLLLILTESVLAQMLTKLPGHTPAIAAEVEPDWPQLPEGWNFGATPDVAVDSKGHAYVFHRGPHPIVEFDNTGKFVRSWGDGLFVSPHGLRFDRQGNLWAVDNGANFVVKMNQKGRVTLVLGQHGSKGETEELFDGPTDIAFASNGDVFVSDGYGNSRIVKYSGDGRFLKAWGKKGSGAGEFNVPHTVVVDDRDRVYVGDRQNYRVQVFDAEGTFIEEWKNVGSPWGLSLSKDEMLFMADGWNDRVLKLSLKGEILGVFGGPGRSPGQFRFAHHLSLGPSGELYVAEIINMRAQKFLLR
ncbi:MAG: peptidyl-alpha-hydroxyglycine alpha-amidating lyase family protein [Acidobacteriota bacterium]